MRKAKRKNVWLHTVLLIVFACMFFGDMAKAAQSEEITYNNYATVKVGETITISNMTDLDQISTWIYKKWSVSNDNVTLEYNRGSTVYENYESVRSYDPESIASITGVVDGQVVVTCLTAETMSYFVVSGYDCVTKTEHYVIDVLGEKTITFHTNGGTCSTTSKSVWRKDAVGTLPTPTRTGYNFLGWYTTASGGTKVSASTVVNADVTYYAHWEKVDMDVNFHANGGTVSQTKKTVKKGTQVGTLPTPTRTGYNFLGWYTAASGGTKVSASTVVNADVTYYAHWEKAIVTITLDANGGTTHETKQYLKTRSAIGNIVTPSRVGYRFKGWYTSKTGGTKVTEKTTFANDATIYAYWDKISVGKTKISKLSATMNKINITIKNVAGVNGYEIKYSTKSNGKNAKYVSGGTTSITIENLKKSKKYYVWVRPYIMDSANQKVYGKYSARKTIKTAAAGFEQISHTLLQGQKKQLKLKGSKGKIKWSSNKKKIVSVNKKGQITAKKKGTATITAKYKNKKYKCTISVENPKLSVTDLTLNKNETKQVRLTETTLQVSYASSNTNVAKVDQYGFVTGVAKGTAIITATVNKKKYRCKVNVKENTTSNNTDNGNNKDDGGNADNGNSNTEQKKQYISADGKFAVNIGEADVIFNGERYSGLPAEFYYVLGQNKEYFKVTGIGPTKGYLTIRELAGYLYSGKQCTKKTYVDAVDYMGFSSDVIVGEFDYFDSEYDWVTTKMDVASLYFSKIDITYETVQNGLVTIRFHIRFMKDYDLRTEMHDLEGFMAVPYTQPTVHTCMQCIGSGKCQTCHGYCYIGSGNSTRCPSCNATGKCRNCGGKGYTPIE
ncbi:MAG: hypothetical protein E7264_03135 [Lachnospiraceae bacterium]|nr:hypothetical protein [Lachnospiraceae bacterium]